MQPYMVCGFEFHLSLEQTITAYRDEEGVKCTAVCIGTSEHVRAALQGLTAPLAFTPCVHA